MPYASSIQNNLYSLWLEFLCSLSFPGTTAATLHLQPEDVQCCGGTDLPNMAYIYMKLFAIINLGFDVTHDY
jgi:hypothetical protein